MDETYLKVKGEANPFDPAWAAYFQDQKLPAGTPVNVWQPDFFRAADRLLGSVPLSTWKTYLRWQLLNTTAPTPDGSGFLNGSTGVRIIPRASFDGRAGTGGFASG